MGQNTIKFNLKGISHGHTARSLKLVESERRVCQGYSIHSISSYGLI